MTDLVHSDRGLVQNFAREHPEQFGQVLATCRSEEAHEILLDLPTTSLIEVLAYSPREFCKSFLETQSTESIVDWIHQGSDDAIARIGRRLPESVRIKITSEFKDSNKYRILREYVHFPKESVAALADKDFLAFSSVQTCEEVKNHFRTLDETESENVLIVNPQDKVLGLLDDRRLLRSGREEPIRVCVRPTTLLPGSALSKAVVELEDWRLVDRLPVIDRFGRAIGILHWQRLIERQRSRADDSHTENQALVMAVVSTMLDVVKEISLPVKQARK